MVFPFRSITTSSSIQEALGYSKPIIFPDLHELDQLPREVGATFHAGDISSLEAALETMFKNVKLQSTAKKAAQQYIGSLSWEKIASDTYSTYELALD